MKILHIYKDYYPVLGGIENHLRTLAEAQVVAGHAVSVLVTARDGRTQITQEQGVRVLRAARLATVGGSVPLSLDFARLLRGERPDIAHLHFPYPVGEVAQWLVGRAPRTVLTYHSDVVRQRMMLALYRPLLWHILRRMARILVTSPNYMRTSPFLSALTERCSVVPLGVDEVRFGQADAGAVAAMRARWGAAEGVPVVLAVGRLRYYKGLDTLIRALPALGARAYRVVLAGDGPQRAALVALVAELGLGARVHFAGDIADADLATAYHAGDVFVLPANARAEAFGMVLTEAMAAGLPCITTEVGTGTSWVVQDGVTGVVVSPLDPAALAGALGALLDDPARRAALGQAGRARILAEFRQADMVARVMRVYEAVL